MLNVHSDLPWVIQEGMGPASPPWWANPYYRIWTRFAITNALRGVGGVFKD